MKHIIYGNPRRFMLSLSGLSRQYAFAYIRRACTNRNPLFYCGNEIVFLIGFSINTTGYADLEFSNGMRSEVYFHINPDQGTALSA